VRASDFLGVLPAAAPPPPLVVGGGAGVAVGAAAARRQSPRALRKISSPLTSPAIASQWIAVSPVASGVVRSSSATARVHAAAAALPTAAFAADDDEPMRVIVSMQAMCRYQTA
jgi:hypothetical protein